MPKVFLLVACCFLMLKADAQVYKNFKEQFNSIKSIRHDSLRLDSMYHFGRMVSDQDITNALVVGRELIRDGELHNNLNAIANGDYLLGISYQYLPDFPKAIKYYLDALRLQKRLNNVNFEIGTYLDIANVYEQTGDMGLQKQFILEAKKVSDEHINDPTLNRKRLMILNNLGTINKKEGRYDTALALYNEVITGSRASNNISLLIAGLSNQAIVYKTIKNFGAALKDYNEALSLIDTTTQDYSNRFQLAALLDNLGILYYEMGDYKQAEHYLLQSNELNKKANVIDLYRDTYDMLRKVYVAQKRYPEALAYFEKWVNVKDTILNSEKSQQMKELQTKYDTEAKDRQIQTQLAQISYNKKINFFLALVSLLLLSIGVLAYLNQRMTAKLNKQIISQKKEVEQLNDVKDRIFSVISHDMRTPVNSLIAFTELLERGNISPEKMVAYSASLKNNLGYTAGLMENLLNWARTQMQGYKPVFETFDIATCAAQAVGLLKQEAEKKGIIIRNEIPADSLVYADINMSSLLIRNLLSNAVKYTPGGGSIVLSAAVIDNKLQVKVTDTGIGVAGHLVDIFNSNSSQPIDSTPGTNHEKGTGLGLMLCKSFVTLMKGKITLESKEGSGSCFTVLLPIPA